MRNRMIDHLLRTAARREGMISFAGGLPATETFPQAALAKASAEAVQDPGPSVLQYDWPEGRLGLRTLIAERMLKRGVTVDPKNIVITNGAQDALAIATEVIGALSIQVGEATYPGALDIFESLSCQPSTAVDLPVQYTMPVVNNPYGGAITAEERARILQAEIIIEDDAYADLSFNGPPPRPLLADAPDRTYFIGTFSKTLAPGLRVGWLIAPAAMREKVMEVKGRHDIQACGLSQAIVERLLGSPSFEPRLERLRTYYRQRSERLLAALSKLKGIHFRIPTGGFSVWVETEIPGSDASLLYAALENGVAFDPGELFLAHPEKHPNLCLRLSYSAVPLDQIEEGVARLGRALDRSRSFSLAA